MNYIKIFIISLLFSTKVAIADFPDDFSNVVWLETNVSGWEETHDLSVSFSGDFIQFNSAATSVWPPVFFGGCKCVGNAWVFIPDGDIWYASTFEYMRQNQTDKFAGAVNGSHTKKSKIPKSYQPAIGSSVGFMLSGLVRNPKVRNESVRTNAVVIKWPRDFPQKTGGGGGSTDPIIPPVYVPVERPDAPATPINPVDPNQPNPDPEGDVACAMVICMFGEVVKKGPQQCEKVVEDFFEIVVYDLPKIPNLAKTYVERAKRLNRCEKARTHEVTEIMATYGVLIKPSP